MKFTTILKELRTLKNLSHEDVALALDLPIEVYSQIEAGTLVPDEETLELMTEYFNVSMDYLITGDDVNEAFQKVKNDLVAALIAANLSEEEVKRFLKNMTEEAKGRTSKIFYERIEKPPVS